MEESSWSHHYLYLSGIWSNFIEDSPENIKNINNIQPQLISEPERFGENFTKNEKCSDLTVQWSQSSARVTV